MVRNRARAPALFCAGESEPVTSRIGCAPDACVLSDRANPVLATKSFEMEQTSRRDRAVFADLDFLDDRSEIK